MITYWGMEVRLQAFFNLVNEWRMVSFMLLPFYRGGKSSGIHCIGGLLGLRAGLEVV
jgi:hypothetical protein